MLLLQGVDKATVMAIMGWSERSMLRRYQHVIDELRLEAARRLGNLIYGEPARATDDSEAWKRVKELEAKIEELNAELMRVKIENAELATELRILTGIIYVPVVMQRIMQRGPRSRT